MKCWCSIKYHWRHLLLFLLLCVLFLLVLFHTRLLPPLLICTMSPPTSLAYQLLLQSPPPSTYTHIRPWRVISSPAPSNCPTPRYLLLQEIIPIVLALDVALKLVLLNHIISSIYINLPRLLTPSFLLLLFQHLLMPFNEIVYSWHPQNIYGFVGEETNSQPILWETFQPPHFPVPTNAYSMQCWNLLEPTPYRITFIELTHKWNLILFIISNSKLGICIYSQPIIDISSQSNLYDVLTLDYTRLFTTQSTNYIPGTHSTYSSSVLWPFHAIIKNISFPLHFLLTRAHRHDNTGTNFRISKMSDPEPPSNISSPEDMFQAYLGRLSILID